MRLTLLGMIAVITAVIVMVLVAHDWDRALAANNNDER
jgi:hypothetical protein